MFDYVCLEVCRGCRAPIEWRERGPFVLCEICAESIAPIATIEQHSASGLSLTIGWALDYDNDLVQRLVRNLKYSHDVLIAHEFARLLEPVCRQLLSGAETIPYVVPVPLHWSREFLRGFNQSALIAEQLCRQLGLMNAPSILRRTRKTRAHHSLSKTHRASNIQGAFTAKLPLGTESNSRSIVLIDDVFTTGATLMECTRTLRAAGFEHISALTAARAY